METLNKISDILSDKMTYKQIAVIASAIITVFSLFRAYTFSEDIIYCLTFGMILFITDIILCSFADTAKGTAMCIVFIFLNTSGVALALMNGTSTIKLAAIIVVSTGTAAIFYHFLPYMIKYIINSKRGTMVALCMMAAVTIVIYIILFFCPKVNGARAWLFIFGISIQLTEITKLIFLIALSVIFASKHLSGNQQLFCSIGFLLINAVFLVVHNELGTLCIMLLVLTIIQFLFGNIRRGIIFIAAVIFLIMIGIMAVNSLHARFENPEAENFLTILVNKVYGRIYKSDQYQTNMAVLGIINGGLWGAASSYIIDIPVGGSDFGFATYCQYFGTISGIIVIICFIFVIYSLQEYFSKTKKFDYYFHIGSIFVISMVMQSIIVVFTNTGFLPVVGIGMPFISDGGSQTVINYIMAVTIVNAFSFHKDDIRPIFKKRTKRKEIFK